MRDKERQSHLHFNWDFLDQVNAQPHSYVHAHINTCWGRTKSWNRCRYQNPHKRFGLFFTNSDDGSWIHNSYMPCFNADTQYCTRSTNINSFNTCKQKRIRYYCHIYSHSNEHKVPSLSISSILKHANKSQWFTLFKGSSWPVSLVHKK